MSELMQIEETIKNQLVVVQEMRRIEDEVKSIRDETLDLHREIKEEIEEIKRTYPLTDGEATMIQSEVMKKSHALTQEYFDGFVSQDLYLMKLGHLRQGIYSALKREFKAVKYTTIKHVQAEEAYKFIQQITLNDLTSNYLRLTPKQQEIARENQDNINGIFRNRNQMDLEFEEA